MAFGKNSNSSDDPGVVALKTPDTLAGLLGSDRHIIATADDDSLLKNEDLVGIPFAIVDRVRFISKDGETDFPIAVVLTDRGRFKANLGGQTSPQIKAWLIANGLIVPAGTVFGPDGGELDVAPEDQTMYDWERPNCVRLIDKYVDISLGQYALHAPRGLKGDDWQWNGKDVTSYRFA